MMSDQSINLAQVRIAVNAVQDEKCKTENKGIQSGIAYSVRNAYLVWKRHRFMWYCVVVQSESSVAWMLEKGRIRKKNEKEMQKNKDEVRIETAVCWLLGVGKLSFAHRKVIIE